MTAEMTPELIDQLIELYCDWRTQCECVQATYEHFATAPATERTLAFATYQAALDREESACDAYAAQARRIARTTSLAIAANATASTSLRDRRVTP